MSIAKRRFRCSNREFDYDHQLQRYYWKLGQGIVQLAERGHPFTVVECPASILEPQYCYDKLKVVLPGMTYEDFAEKHAAVVVPKHRDRLRYIGDRL